MKLNIVAFKRLTLKKKALVVSVVMVPVFVFLFALFVYNLGYKTILKERKIASRDIVKLVQQSVNHAYTMYQKKQMTEEQAKKMAIASISHFAYGDNNKNYIFVIDNKGVFISHPIKSFIGTNKYDLKGKKGKYIIREMIRVAKQKQKGFVEYYWTSQIKKNKIALKTSYIQYFKEWNWIIGTGIDSERVKEQIKSNISYFLGFGFVFIFISALLINLLLQKLVITPLQKAEFVIQKSAQGDFTHRLVKHSDDEIGQIIEHISNLSDSLRDIFQNTKSSVIEISEFANKISKETGGISNNAKSQEIYVQRMSESLHSFLRLIENVNKKTFNQFENINTLTSHINLLFNKIHDMKSGIRETNNLTSIIANKSTKGESSLEKINTRMQKISDSSAQMGDIIGIINDISEKINLLALNASIEAARAGEVGRGFAVVAEQISKLAEQTASSVAGIKNLIDVNDEEIAMFVKDFISISNVISSTNAEIKNITKKMDSIDVLMQEQITTGKTVNEEAENVMKISEEVNASSKKQKTGIDEIKKFLDTFAELIKKDTTAIVEMHISTDKIASMSQTLEENLKKFKT